MRKKISLISKKREALGKLERLKVGVEAEGRENLEQEVLEVDFDAEAISAM